MKSSHYVDRVFTGEEVRVFLSTVQDTLINNLEEANKLVGMFVDGPRNALAVAVVNHTMKNIRSGTYELNNTSITHKLNPVVADLDDIILVGSPEKKGEN